MPKPVQFGALGVVNYPDDMSDDEILADYQNARADLIKERQGQMEQETYDEEMKRFPRLNERGVAAMFIPGAQALIGPEERATFAANVWRGITQGGGAVAKTAGRIHAQMPPAMQEFMAGGGDFGGPLPGSAERIVRQEAEIANETPQQTEARVDSHPFTEFGRRIQDMGELAPRNEALSRTFLYGDVPQGLGSLASAVAAAPLGPAAVLGATFGAEFDDAYESEMARQRTDGEPPDTEKALLKATAYGAVATAIENKFGTGRVANRLKQFFRRGDAASLLRSPNTAGAMVGELVKEGFVGAGEESAQTIVQNLIIDGQVKWGEVMRSGAVGALIQGPTALAGPAGRAFRTVTGALDPSQPSREFASVLEQAAANEFEPAVRAQMQHIRPGFVEGGRQISTDPRQIRPGSTPLSIQEEAEQAPVPPPTVLPDPNDPFPRRGPFTPQDPRAVRRPRLVVPGEDVPPEDRENILAEIRRRNITQRGQLKAAFPLASDEQLKLLLDEAWHGRQTPAIDITYTPPEPSTTTPDATTTGQVQGGVQTQRPEAGQGGQPATPSRRRRLLSTAERRQAAKAPPTAPVAPTPPPAVSGLTTAEQELLTNLEITESLAKEDPEGYSINADQKKQLAALRKKSKAKAPVAPAAPKAAPVPKMTRDERDDLAALRSNKENGILRPESQPKLDALEAKAAAIEAAKPKKAPSPAPAPETTTTAVATTTPTGKRRALVKQETKVPAQLPAPPTTKTTFVTQEEYDDAVKSLEEESFQIGRYIWGRPDRLDVLKNAPVLIQGGRKAIQDLIQGGDLSARFGELLMQRGYVPRGSLEGYVRRLERLVRTVQEKNIRGTQGYEAPNAPSAVSQVTTVPEVRGRSEPGLELVTRLGIETGENVEGTRTTRRVNTPITFADVNVLVALDRADKGEQDRSKLTAAPTGQEIGDAAVRAGSTFKERESNTRTHLLVFNKTDGLYHFLPIWRNGRGVVVIRENPTDRTGKNFQDFLRSSENWDMVGGRGGKPVYRVVLNTGSMFMHETFTQQQVEDMRAAMAQLMGTTTTADETSKEIISRVVRQAVAGNLEAAEDDPQITDEDITPLYEDQQTGELAPVRPVKLDTQRRWYGEGTAPSIFLTAVPRLEKVANNLFYGLKAIKGLNASKAALFIASKARAKSASSRQMVKSVIDEARRQLEESGYFQRKPDANKIEASGLIAAKALATVSNASRRRGGGRFAAELVAEIGRLVSQRGAGLGATSASRFGQPAEVAEGGVKERTVLGLKAGLTQTIERGTKDGTLSPEEATLFTGRVQESLSQSELQEIGSDMEKVMEAKLPENVARVLNFPQLNWSQNPDGTFTAPASIDLMNWLDADNRRAAGILGIRTGKDANNRSIVTAAEVPGMQTKYRYGVRISNPMSVKAVTDAVKKRLGVKVLPKNIRVVQAPIRGSRIWMGRVDFTRDGPIITLNANHIGSESEAEDTILEEALHIAFKDNRIIRDWRAVLQHVNLQDVMQYVTGGYTDSEAVEEAANELVRTINATAKGRTMWQRFVASIQRFWNQLLGRQVGLNPAVAERLVARALIMTRGNDGSVAEETPTPISSRLGETTYGGLFFIDPSNTRFSLVKPGNLIFGKRGQVEELENVPGLEQQQVDTIKGVAASQAGLVQEDTYRQIQVWKNGQHKAEVIAGNAMAPVERAYELTGVQPWQAALEFLPPGASVNDQLPENRDLASVAVIHQDKSFQKLYARLEREAAKSAEQLEAAMADLPDAQLRDIESSFAQSLADELVKGMGEQLQNLAQTGPATLTDQQRQMMDRMASDLKDAEGADKPAIRVALLNLARSQKDGGIPDGVLAGTEAVTDSGSVVPAGTAGTTTGVTSIINWIKAQTSNPIAAPPIVEWLVTANAGAVSPLESYHELVDNLSQLRGIIDNREAALKQIKDFKDWFFTNAPKQADRSNRVTLLQFAKKYSAWRAQHKEAAEMARRIRQNIKRWDDRFRGFTMASEELERMMSDPAYQDKVKQAVDLLEASEADISVVDGTGKRYAAKGPLKDFTPEARFIDYAPTEKAATTNSVNAVTIAEAIQRWMDSDDAKANPASAAAWKREQQWLTFHGMMTAAVSSNYGQIGTRLFGIPSQIFLALGAPGPKQGLKRMLGRYGQQAFGKAVNNWSTVASGLDDIFRDEKIGWFALQDVVIKAAESHGIKLEDMASDWMPILSKMMARNASAGGATAGIGDRIHVGDSSVVITKEDMEAARLMKRNTDAVRKFISSNKQWQELMESPLQINDEDANIYRNAAAAGYLLVVPRTFSSPGTEFARKWNDARQAEDQPLDDKGNPVPTINRRVDFLNQNIGVLNDYWSTSNPEFLNSTFFRGDDLIKAAHRERIADQKVRKAVDLGFHNVDEYAAWIGGLRAQANNTDIGTETVKAKRALIEQMDAYVDAIIRYTKKDEEGGVKVANEASPVAVFANTGKGPLTQPRGSMVAPDFFYDYTTATHVNYSNFRGKALLPFIVRVHHELNALAAAVKAAVDDRTAYLKSKETPGPFAGFRSRRALRKEEIAAAREGKFVAPLRELKLVLRMVNAEKARLAVNLAKAKDELYDSTSIDIARRAESMLTLPLLFSESATLNNAMSAVFGGALIDTMAGNTSFFTRLPWELGKLHIRTMKLLATTVARSKPLDAVFKKYPKLFNGFSNLILKWVQQEAMMAAITNAAGVGTTLNVIEHIRAIKRSPATYGDVESRELTTLQRGANRAMAFLSGWMPIKFARDQAPNWMRQLVPEGIKERLRRNTNFTIPGVEGARNWSQLVDNFTLKQVAMRIVANLDRIQKAMYDAMEARESGEKKVANHKDPTQPLTPFTPEELGLTSNKDLEMFRRWFLPAGNLENVALDYWNRAKAAPDDAARAQVEFLTEPQENSIVREMFRYSSNPVDEANRITRFGATGNIGLTYQVLFRFQNWSTNMASSLNALTERDLRDKPEKDALNILKILALLMMAAFTALFMNEEKAVLRAAISNDEPSLPRMDSVEGAGDFARLAAASMAAGLVPYYGEWLARAMGTSANRPLFDLTGMVPLAGLVARAADTTAKIFQSDDPMFPLLDFVRNSMPYTRPFIGAAERLGIEPFAGEAGARQASRAIRSAAPAEMERTAVGGVGGRLTPMSGIMRRAIAAAYSGNEDELQNQIDQAVAYKVAQGQSEDDARRSVLQSLEARVPSRRVLGKLPTEEEESRIIDRMTPSQAAAYERSKDAFNLVGQAAGHEIPFTARGGSGTGSSRRRSLTGRRLSRLRPTRSGSRRRLGPGFGSSRSRSRSRRRAVV